MEAKDNQPQISKNEALLKRLFRQEELNINLPENNNEEAEKFLEQVLTKVEQENLRSKLITQLPIIAALFLVTVALLPKLPAMINSISSTYESIFQPYINQVLAFGLPEKLPNPNFLLMLLAVFLIAGLPVLFEKINI